MISDFGPVGTTGAFRLRYAPGTAWELTPLPGSESFQVQLRLDRLSAPTAKVRQVEAQNLAGHTLAPVAPEQDGPLVRWKTDSPACRYLIRFQATCSRGTNLGCQGMGQTRRTHQAVTHLPGV